MVDQNKSAAFGEVNSALQDHLGYELTAWSAGKSELHLPVTPFLMNRAGIPHGGIYATLLDTTMGYAGCYSDVPGEKIYTVTLSLTVNFLAQPDGDLLIAKGQKTGGGRKIFFAEGQVFDASGRVIARASGTFKYVNAPDIS